MTSARCIFAAQIPMVLEHPCGMHSHACTEIVYYLDGSGYLTQGEKRLHYEPGFASIYQPGLEHSDTPNSNGTQICIGASGCGAEKLPTGMWAIDEGVTQCIQLILKEMSSPSAKNNQERLDILTGWLVLELRRITGENKAKASGSDYVDKARQILDSQFNEQIDLQELASKLYINPDYLRHIFKQSLGESPLNYLIRKRLDAACELLNFTDLPVGEVAKRIGLDNVYYFSRIFRKRLGLTPSEYRQKARKKVKQTIVYG
jgi:AraC family transcriptional activator of pobA